MRKAGQLVGDEVGGAAGFLLGGFSLRGVLLSGARDLAVRAGDCAGDGRAARDGEEDDSEQRKIEQSERRPETRKFYLHQDAGERRQYCHPRGEAVLVEFAAGCVTVFGHRCG